MHRARRLLRSEYSGASQDLRRKAMLVAQMSRPMHCSSVLRSTWLLPSEALIKACSFISLADTSKRAFPSRLVKHLEALQKRGHRGPPPAPANCVVAHQDQGQHFGRRRCVLAADGEMSFQTSRSPKASFFIQVCLEPDRPRT